MSDKLYNVVFEYDETTGGAYGVRTWTSYRDQTEAKAMIAKRTNEKIIARGVSDEEAMDLTSLTPEICRLMCAVEQAFQDEDLPSSGMINFHITNAKYAIAADRQRISERQLVRHDANQYIQAARHLLTDKSTFKTAAMQGTMIFLMNLQGQVSLDLQDFNFLHS
jgi:hypothetical protein